VTALTASVINQNTEGRFITNAVFFTKKQNF
jgi:hypothetical protein